MQKKRKKNSRGERDEVTVTTTGILPGVGPAGWPQTHSVQPLTGRYPTQPLEVSVYSVTIVLQYALVNA